MVRIAQTLAGIAHLQKAGGFVSHHGAQNVRASHWIPANHQCRIPKRWVVFDTESKSAMNGKTEIQSWRLGSGIRWRHGLRSGDQAEAKIFSSPRDLWEWISAYTRKGERTVVMAHNLGHDVRISEALSILPELGFTLEWCNLDRNVSAMTWRSDHGTLILADTFTWLPLALASIAPDVGLSKLQMPPDTAKHARWEKYCMRDTEIGYHIVKELITFIAANDLGNWQPTGAGMAYATWRHKFLSHKVLVHDDMEAIAAERAAMHCGRAEAWRHGKLERTVWSEVDMKDAYIRIAAECQLPVKLKYRTGAITNAQYHRLSHTYRVLAHIRCSTRVPCIPYHTGAKTIWPTGQFDTWLWDTEIALLDEEDQAYQVLDAYVYAMAPVLQEWAQWILDLRSQDDETVSPVVKTWAKHCGRALIGRLSLRCPQWELFGENPDGVTGITYTTDSETGITHRMMHVGNQTLIETSREEGRDSLPQLTGWIMAECRARLWRAMRAAGLDNLAHVDTDSVLISSAGLAQLRAALGTNLGGAWALKGAWRKVIVYGPRNYRAGELRKVAGVPKKADEILPNVFKGEKWSALATDLENGRHNRVTTELATWELKVHDARREGTAGIGTGTVALEVYSVASSVAPSSSKDG
jgi:hypothetical protein